MKYIKISKSQWGFYAAFSGWLLHNLKNKDKKQPDIKENLCNKKIIALKEENVVVLFVFIVYAFI